MALEKLIKVTMTTHLKITHMYNSEPHPSGANELTHWGWVRHIWVSKLTTIYSDNGLSPGRRQANIWTNAGILWIEPLGTNFTEISIKIYKFSFKKIHLKMLSGKWLPFCFSLNVLVFSTTHHQHPLQAPVPLSIFRSNSKFDENSECSSFEYTRPITTIFCTRHDSDTVVTCAKYRCDRPCIFYTRVFGIFIEFRIRSKYA